MVMRLFVAIRFNPRMLGALSLLMDTLKRSGVRGRYTSLNQLHLTLAFIGETNKNAEALRVLQSVPVPQMTLELDKIGHFGPLIYVGLKETPELMEYVQTLREALKRAGIPYDAKPFRPHITLVRKGSHIHQAVQIPGAAMDVAAISLMKSEFTERGVKYTEIGRSK
jgi:2'-5' RNA ligase